MEDEVLDAIEEEILEAQKNKEIEKKNTPSSRIEGSDEAKEDYVVPNNPEVSTNYKDRLVRVYDELTNIKPDDLETQIAEIREELKKVIEEIEENDKRIRKNVVEKIDEAMIEDKDYHYMPKTKGNVVQEAREPIFTPINILLFSCIVAIMMLGIIILSCYK